VSLSAESAKAWLIRDKSEHRRERSDREAQGNPDKSQRSVASGDRARVLIKNYLFNKRETRLDTERSEVSLSAESTKAHFMKK